MEMAGGRNYLVVFFPMIYYDVAFDVTNCVQIWMEAFLSFLKMYLLMNGSICQNWAILYKCKERVVSMTHGSETVANVGHFCVRAQFS